MCDDPSCVACNASKDQVEQFKAEGMALSSQIIDLIQAHRNSSTLPLPLKQELAVTAIAEICGTVAMGQSVPARQIAELLRISMLAKDYVEFIQQNQKNPSQPRQDAGIGKLVMPNNGTIN